MRIDFDLNVIVVILNNGKNVTSLGNYSRKDGRKFSQSPFNLITFEEQIWGHT